MLKKLPLIALCLMLTSCSVLDYPSRIAGYSTQKFENEKAGRFEQTFDTSKNLAFNDTLAVIKELRARVTHKNLKKGFVIAFDFSKSFDYCLDSTEVGFFIEELNENSVKITVISNNSLLARNVSYKYFELLTQKRAEPQEQPEE